MRDRVLGRHDDNALLATDIRAIAAQVGLDLDAARAVDLTTLRMLLSLAGTLDDGRCWLMAELLYLEGLRARGAGDMRQARLDIHRALQLQSWINPAWQPFEELPTVGMRMAELQSVLDSLPDR